MTSSVRIVAPSRIHFGLLSVDKDAERRFGGVGVMLDQPALELRIRRSPSSEYIGELAGRAKGFVEHWQNHTGIHQPVTCEILRSPPQHVGLGLGTQLGLSVAWALDSLFDRDDVPLEDRAASVDRGKRSAVGTHGFVSGGMIVEDGKGAGETIGVLRERIALPEDWRVVLFRIAGVSGLAGAAEVNAFAELPPVSDELKTQLRRELHDRLVPAARNGDFGNFSESVYQYGFAAGQCFADSQGGPFLTASIAEFISYCRDVGVPGVGQSSWGPTVYCWFPNETSANEFVRKHDSSVAGETNLRGEWNVCPVAQTGSQRYFD